NAVITRLTRLMSLSCRRHIAVAWVRAASAERAREMPLNSRISEKIKPKGSSSFGPPATECALAACEPECRLLARLPVSATFPDSCVRARVGLRSRSPAGVRIGPKELEHVSLSDVGRQPHGPHLLAARHLYLAHAVDV